MEDLEASGISHPLLLRGNSTAQFKLEAVLEKLVTPHLSSPYPAAPSPETTEVGAGEDESIKSMTD